MELLEEVPTLVAEPPIPWLFEASPVSSGWQQPALELHGPLAGSQLHRLSPRLPGVRLGRKTVSGPSTPTTKDPPKTGELLKLGKCLLHKQHPQSLPQCSQREF